jgi:hypothetical protein
MTAQFSSRRLLLAGSFALALTLVPLAVVTASADSSSCQVTQSAGSASLNCSPGPVTAPGAPSEQQLTTANTNRHGGGGLLGGGGIL